MTTTLDLDTHRAALLRMLSRIWLCCIRATLAARTGAFILFIVSLASSASEVFPTIEHYVARTTGKSASELVIYTSGDNSRKPISPVFGIAHSVNSANRIAYVFVLAHVAGGGFREVAVSQPFDFSDQSDRTYVNWVEAQSVDRYSIQFHNRTVCGIHANVYRFIRLRDKWYVAGLDRWDSVCTDDGTLGIGESLSINHLTGRFIEERFKNHKLISTRTSYKFFPKFPLSEFSVFNKRYRGEK